MQKIPLDLEDVASLERFRQFLGAIQDEAETEVHAKIVSITLRVPHIDPLAVLDSIYEPSAAHGYFENPLKGTAMAGAEAVWMKKARGPRRIQILRKALQEWSEHTVMVGETQTSGAGPNFLFGASFEEEGDAFVFLPLWQVSAHRGQYLAMANCLIDEETEIEAIASRIWSAHAKFRSFNYSDPPLESAPHLINRSEVGTKDNFVQNVEKGLENIRDGRYEKIVLARAQDLEFDRTLLPLKVLNRLRNRFRGCTSFSLEVGDGIRFIGATPEHLLRVEGGALETEAIAGSIRRGQSSTEDARLAAELLGRDKDLREHAHVVHSIRRHLALMGLETFAPDRPELLTLPNVFHLRTPIRGNLSPDHHILDVAARLHPTPATGGSPRSTALPDIQAFEPCTRGLYAGLGGWLNLEGDGELFVLLRSARIEGSTARLFAGAGIVEGSQPELEFQETEIKMDALRLGICGDSSQ